MKRFIAVVALLLSCVSALLLGGCGAGAEGPPLATPLGVAAKPGNGLVTVSWSAVSEATSYQVLRASGGGAFVALGTTDATLFADNTVSNRTAYSYEVVAQARGFDPSLASAPVTATPMAAPAMPSALTATPGDGAVRLTWSASSDAVTYTVARASASGGPYTAVASVTSPSFSESGLINGSAYYYVVSAVNPVATSANSSEVKSIPIAAPTGVEAVASDQQVALFWQPVAGARSYQVWASIGGGSAALVGAVTANRFLASGLTNGVSVSYQVAGVNETGTSALSVAVPATPGAEMSPLPPADDATRNAVGMNTWFENDWDGSAAFADVFKQARPWQNPPWTASAAVDADGWPTEDASTVLMSGTPAQINGVYQLVFHGKADVTCMWCSSGSSVTNQSYDASSNTSRATVNVVISGSGSMGLIFTNTQRTAASVRGTGFTDAQLYRPGYPSDGSVLFTAPFLAAMGRTPVIRMMEWQSTNSNFIVDWADRARPGSATQGGLPVSYTAPDGTVFNGTKGVAVEYQIALCNQLLADCYINVPVAASDDYVTNLALALRFGTDGVNPYTSQQASPVFAPLNPALHVYVEYANEIWNSGAPVFFVVKAFCEHLPAGHPLLAVDGDPGIWFTMWRYPAWRITAIRQIFASIFGEGEMMTRVRPVLMTQQGDGQATLDVAMQWLNDYAATLSPAMTPAQILYGGGGSAYYGVNSATSASPDAFFAEGNYPVASTLLNWAVDSEWTANYGVRHLAYEGGPGLSFTDADSRTINADPRMMTMMKVYQDEWSKSGGDLLVYYNVHGPPDWEFTPDINTVATPKFAALSEIEASPRAAVTLGAVLPGTLLQTDQAGYAIRKMGSYGYATTVDGVGCAAGNPAGSWIAYPAHASTAFHGSLTVSGNSDPGAQLAIWVNGVRQGTVTLAASPVLETSTSLPVEIPAGLSVLRLETVSGNMNFCSLTVQ